MNTPHVTLATEAHIKELAQKLRPEDVIEVYLASGQLPLDALMHSFKMSDVTWAIHYNGEVVGAFGVGAHPTEAGTGIPWLLSSEKMDEISRTFLKSCPIYIDVMHNHYNKLVNVSYENHHKAHRWLMWCGFTKGRVYPQVGPERSAFIEFYRYRSNV